MEAESDQGIYWGFMHASPEQRARPCCTLAIIEEDVYTLERVWHSPAARPFGRVVVEPPIG